MSAQAKLLLVLAAICGSTRSETVVQSEPKSLDIPRYYSSSHLNSNPSNHHYTSSYTNTGQQNMAAARDSYSEAATDLGYGAPIEMVHSHSSHSGGQPMMYHYQVQPMQSSGSYGMSSHEEDGDEKGGGGGGNIGLLGLLGLKGLKGVKAVKIAKAAAILAPVIAPVLLPLVLPVLLPLALPLLPILLAPILLPLLLILPLAILFFPVPVVTIPVARLGTAGTRAAMESFLNGECADRITCEISRAAKSYGYDPPWVKNLIQKPSKSKWAERLSKAYQSEECNSYKCDVVSSLKKTFKIGDFNNAEQ